MSAEFGVVRDDDAGVSSRDCGSDVPLDWGLVSSGIGDEVLGGLFVFVYFAADVAPLVPVTRRERAFTGEEDALSSASLSSLMVGSSVVVSSLPSRLEDGSLDARLSLCFDRFEDELVCGNSHSRPPFLHPVNVSRNL
jgi:hypothetical protein